MKKKKLQLEELKVKSFLSIVNKEEQRTTKGGYVKQENRVRVAVEKYHDLSAPSWTSEKTRATSSDSILTRFGGNNKIKG